jgi:hypothetical protein
MFRHHLKYIPADSLKSINNIEIEMENKLQKELMISYEERAEILNQKISKIKKKNFDLEIEHLFETELRYCEGIIKQATEYDYPFKWLVPIFRYRKDIQSRLQGFYNQETAKCLKYDTLNQREVVALYKNLLDIGYLPLENYNQLSVFLEAHIECKDGMLKNTRAILSRMKNEEISSEYPLLKSKHK